MLTVFSIIGLAYLILGGWACVWRFKYLPYEYTSFIIRFCSMVVSICCLIYNAILPIDIYSGLMFKYEGLADWEKDEWEIAHIIMKILWYGCYWTLFVVGTAVMPFVIISEQYSIYEDKKSTARKKTLIYLAIYYGVIGTIGLICLGILLCFKKLSWTDLPVFIRAGAHLYGMIKVIFLLGHALIFSPNVRRYKSDLYKCVTFYEYNLGKSGQTWLIARNNVRECILKLLSIKDKLDQFITCQESSLFQDIEKTQILSCLVPKCVTNDRFQKGKELAFEQQELLNDKLKVEEPQEIQKKQSGKCIRFSYPKYKPRLTYEYLDDAKNIYHSLKQLHYGANNMSSILQKDHTLLPGQDNNIEKKILYTKISKPDPNFFQKLIKMFKAEKYKEGKLIPTKEEINWSYNALVEAIFEFELVNTKSMVLLNKTLYYTEVIEMLKEKKTLQDSEYILPMSHNFFTKNMPNFQMYYYKRLRKIFQLTQYIIFVITSALLFFSEVTQFMFPNNKGLLGYILDWLRSQGAIGFILFIVVFEFFISYFQGICLEALLSLTVAMHTNDVDKYCLAPLSLLSADALLTTIASPIAFNTMSIIFGRNSNYIKHTSFYNSIGDQEVIPILGVQVPDYLPTVLIILVQLSLFNGYTRIFSYIGWEIFVYDGVELNKKCEKLDDEEFLTSEQFKNMPQETKDEINIKKSGKRYIKNLKNKIKKKELIIKNGNYTTNNPDDLVQIYFNIDDLYKEEHEKHIDEQIIEEESDEVDSFCSEKSKEIIRQPISTSSLKLSQKKVVFSSQLELTKQGDVQHEIGKMFQNSHYKVIQDKVPPRRYSIYSAVNTLVDESTIQSDKKIVVNKTSIDIRMRPNLNSISRRCDSVILDEEVNSIPKLCDSEYVFDEEGVEEFSPMPVENFDRISDENKDLWMMSMKELDPNLNSEMYLPGVNKKRLQ